jgi:hypothetical protein
MLPGYTISTTGTDATDGTMNKSAFPRVWTVSRGYQMSDSHPRVSTISLPPTSNREPKLLFQQHYFDAEMVGAPDICSDDDPWAIIVGDLLRVS